MGWHQTIIVGNLGTDPDLRYLQSGQSVCNFRVAVSETWRDRQTNERQEKTTWYAVAVWGPQAEHCNTYLSKGRQVLVIGNVFADAYMNNSGEAAASLKLNARSVQFLGGRNQDGGDSQGGGWQGGGQRSGQGQSQRQDDRASNYQRPNTVDDIPF